MSILYGGSRRKWFKNKKKTRQPRSEREQQVIFWWRVVIGLALLLLLALSITGVHKVTRHPSVTITAVDVQGGETIDPSEVEYRARELLKGTYLFVIPRSFAYLYPEGEIEDAVKRIERVRDVEVKRDSPTAIEITFSEYVPYALWCEELSASSTDRCLFLDPEGYAFGPAPSLSGSSFVRIITKGKEPQKEKHVLPIEELRIFGEFMNAVRTEGKMRIYAITKTEEGDVYYHVSGGGSIVVSGTDSIQDAFDTLTSVLDSEAFAHIAPGNFEYIDLRFENKVFVKEVDEEESEEVITDESVLEGAHE